MAEQHNPTVEGPGALPAPTPGPRSPRPAVRRPGTVRTGPVLGYESTAPHWLRSMAGVSWRLLVVVAAIALVFYATSRVQLLFIAVFIALVFTAVLRPAVEFLSRYMPRFLATALSLLLGILLLVGMLAYVGVSVAGQWVNLSDQFGSGIEDLKNLLINGPLPFVITNDQINQWITDGQTWLQQHSGELAGQAAAGAGSVVEVITALILAVFCSIFFLARGAEMWTWFLNQLPTRARSIWQEAAGAGWYTFSGYTRGTVIIAVTDGLLAFIFLSILGVPLAAPLAVLVLIGAFIPLVGAPTALVVAMIVALAANGPIQAALVGIGIALIGQFEGHVLQPLVMGRQVSLHPVVIALVITAGTLTAGILGAVIAVPLVAVAWAIFSKLRTIDPPMDEDQEEDSLEDVAVVEG
ncbi:AI-2E family transporter [Pengzhenrongella phosphoraccumulans]|uniref:AI-2E family transporter n=1 Tax=Pengzhenrongella phosphoraccumulans TaxID=3114394 RepID=UPI00388EC3E1